jgi:hypothetical protein
MFTDYFEELETEELDNENGMYWESACCGNVREKDIYNAIDEYKRSNEWN